MKEMHQLFSYISLHSFTQKNLQNKIDKSFKKSELKEVLSQLFRDIFIDYLWLSALNINTNFNVYTLSILRSKSPKESQLSINELVRLNLIYDNSSTRSYSFNESYRDLANHLLEAKPQPSKSLLRLGENWKEIHQKIILKFKNSQDLFSKSNDIYFLENLKWHIEEGEWVSYTHKIIESIYNFSDIRLAQYQVYEISKNSIEDLLDLAEKDIDISDYSQKNKLFRTFKFNLIRAIYRFRSTSIPSNWFRELIENGFINKDQARNFIVSQSEASKISSSIKSLAEYLNQEEISNIVDNFNFAKCERSKSDVFISIFKKSNIDTKLRIVEESNTIKNEVIKGECLSSYIENSPITLHNKIFISIRNIQDEYIKSNLIQKFIPKATKPIKKEILKLINTIEDVEIKYQLLAQSLEYFPKVKKDIIYLSKNLSDSYIKFSILWKLLETPNKTYSKISQWLKRIDSPLDKILFFSDRIDEAETEEEISELWKIALNYEDKDIHLHLISCFISQSTSLHLDEIIKKVIEYPDEKHKLETLGQCHIYGNHNQTQAIEKEILNSKSEVQKLKILCQIYSIDLLDKSDIKRILLSISDEAVKIQIILDLLEADEWYSDIFFRELEKVLSEEQKCHFIKQAIFIIPGKELERLYRQILSFSSVTMRDELMNLLIHRIPSHQLCNYVIEYLSTMHPEKEFINAARLINRNYWEQISEAPISSCSNQDDFYFGQSEEILSEILNMPDQRSQTHLIKIFLKEYNLVGLDQDGLIKIIKILPQGSLSDFIDCIPQIAQGIASSVGNSALPEYAELCLEFSKPKIPRQATQSIESIDHKFPLPEPLKKMFSEPYIQF